MTPALPRKHLAVDPSADEDQRFDLLGSPRRREVLHVLYRHGGPLEFSELAARVAAVEVGTTIDAVTPRERKRVYVSCYQTHVPRLQEAGYVSHDADAGLVRLTAKSEALRPYLWKSTQHTARDNSILALALACLAFYGGVLLDLPLLGAIPTTIASPIVILALVALVVVRTRRGSPPPRQAGSVSSNPR